VGFLLIFTDKLLISGNKHGHMFEEYNLLLCLGSLLYLSCANTVLTLADMIYDLQGFESGQARDAYKI
jgi:hypothetical protein